MKSKLILIMLALFVFGVVFSVQAKMSNFSYDDHGRRDPFWRLVGTGGEIINYEKEFLSSDMVLEGIMVEPSGNNVAIINGIIVKVNDEVGSFLVKSVEMNSVVLQKGTEIITLRIKKED